MLTVVRPIYYCEHCKRHRLRAAAIVSHEPRCIYNPRRLYCGWHPDMPPGAPADFALVLVQDFDLDWLRQVVDGCPTCALAVVIQARRLGLDDEEAWAFDYRAEVERYRAAERYADAF